MSLGLASLRIQGTAALQGSDTEQKVASLLFDEMKQVLSSFELNQLASLSYNDGPCEEMFEMIEKVLEDPLEHSVLCIQKALVVVKHIVLYGSEDSVSCALTLKRHVDFLREFNTVLMAQKRSQADSIWQRVKGGGVDKGFPVREASKDLFELMASPDHIALQRQIHANPNSLVPVGDDKAQFVSDEVRLFMLERRMKEQQLQITKSNLAKERGGFGSGYVGKDGKAVVGAAHGLEEMMAHAQRRESKFSDVPKPNSKPRSAAYNNDLLTSSTVTVQTSNTGPQVDLLTSSTVTVKTSNTAPQVDLLDFSASTTETPAAPQVDLLDFGSSSTPEPAVASTGSVFDAHDPLATAPQPTASSGVSATSDLLSLMTVAPAPSESKNDPVDATPDSVPSSDLPPSQPSATLTAAAPMKNSVMSSNADRFSALDNLVPANKTFGSILTGKEAENRILGNLDSLSSSAAAAPPSTTTSSSHPTESSFMESMAPPIMTEEQAPVVPDVDYSSMSMGGHFGVAEDDDENGFVMGGSSGMGLEPTAPPPPMPPPPPPPS